MKFAIFLVQTRERQSNLYLNL